MTKSNKGKNFIFYGNNITSVARKEVSRLFYDGFLKKLDIGLTKYFGKEESIRTMKSLSSGRVRLINPETFFFNIYNINDNSLELYNSCKNFDDFYTRGVMAFKKRAESGEIDIEVREFFLALTDLLSSSIPTFTIADLKKYLLNLILTFSNATHKSPFIFTLFLPDMRKDIEKLTGLNLYRYATFLNVFFEAYDTVRELVKGDSDTKISIPTINLLCPIYKDTKNIQKRYLAFVFRQDIEHIENCVKHLTSLSEDTPQLRATLEYLDSESEFPHSINLLIAELQRIENEDIFKTYPIRRTITDPLKEVNISRGVIAKHRINCVYINQETFLQSFQPYFCNVEIDCHKLTFPQIEKHIGTAKVLSLLKFYSQWTLKHKMENPTFKIVLTNVEALTQEFVNTVEEKRKSLESVTGRNFTFEIQYDEKVAQTRAHMLTSSHFRVISDIHADYNKEDNYWFNFGNDFVINCGDTAGSSLSCAKWNKTFISNGVTVVGNHLGYSYAHPELNGIDNMEKYGNIVHPDNTKNTQLKELVMELRHTPVRVLSNSVTEKDGIIILGTCLYTDFALYGEDHIEECMAYAKHYMNDFKYPMVVGHRDYELTPNGWKVTKRPRNKSSVRPFTPQDHAYFFHYSINFLKEKVEEYKHKPIIIVTHHAPSPYAIADKYKGSLLNAAFASNLNKFIIGHPQIRLWCFGHVHTPCDFILGETRLVCCPFGYHNENNFKLPDGYGTRIAIADVKSKKSWKTICKEEIKKGKIQIYEG